MLTEPLAVTLKVTDALERLGVADLLERALKEPADFVVVVGSC